MNDLILNDINKKYIKPLVQARYSFIHNTIITATSNSGILDDLKKEAELLEFWLLYYK